MSIGNGPPPKKPSSPTLVVREAALIAAEFAKDFERLMETYQIKEYDLRVKGPVFQLCFQSAKQQKE